MNKIILLVEDDANLLFSLQAKLRVEGFSIITDDGMDHETVMNKIKNLHPNYIILDLILPKIDGLKLLAEIKSDQIMADIPVFVFTNLSDADSKAKSLKFGADSYFLKTDFSLDEFIQKIKKVIANKDKL